MEFLHSAQYNEALSRAVGKNRFRSQENDLLEIQVNSDSTKVVINRMKCYESNRDNWLQGNMQVSDPSAFGSLKLIISKPQQVKDRVGKYIPFSRETFEMFLDIFRVPQQFIHMALGDSAAAAKFTAEDPDGSTWVSFMARAMWAGVVRHVLVVSYNVTHGVTYGLVEDYFEDLNMDDFVNHIVSMKKGACHPMLVPVIISGDHTDNQDIHNTWETDEMYEFESESGATIYYKDSKKPPDIMNLNRDGLLTVRINDVARDSGYTLRSVQSAVLAYRLILQTMDIVESRVPESRKELLRDIGKDLREYIDYQLNRSENLILRTQETQHRATLQMSAVYNLLLQRDNLLNLQVAKDSARTADSARQDSSAMKTIAVLTIIFLPGTFVASFFSMPLFDWNADSASAIAKPRFYLYWVVTIPSTLLVIAIWIVWIRINNRGSEVPQVDLDQGRGSSRRESDTDIARAIHEGYEGYPGEIHTRGVLLSRGKQFLGLRRDRGDKERGRQYEGHPGELRTRDLLLGQLSQRKRRPGRAGKELQQEPAGGER